MKKIFLLTLISVFFLSAFSQSAPKTEIIAKFDLVKFVEDDDIPDIQNGFWIFFYKTVQIIYHPNGSFTVYCSGWGKKMCWAKIANYVQYRGIASETIEKTCEELKNESDEQIAKGVFSGTSTRKVAQLDLNGRIDSYLIFKIDWDHDPRKPYNGKAEITITKTDKLAF
jgi:hypothetical protein